MEAPRRRSRSRDASDGDDVHEAVAPAAANTEWARPLLMPVFDAPFKCVLCEIENKPATTKSFLPTAARKTPQKLKRGGFILGCIFCSCDFLNTV